MDTAKGLGSAGGSTRLRVFRVPATHSLLFLRVGEGGSFKASLRVAKGFCALGSTGSCTYVVSPLTLTYPPAGQRVYHITWALSVRLTLRVSTECVCVCVCRLRLGVGLGLGFGV